MHRGTSRGAAVITVKRDACGILKCKTRNAQPHWVLVPNSHVTIGNKDGQCELHSILPPDEDYYDTPNQRILENRGPALELQSTSWLWRRPLPSNSDEDDHQLLPYYYIYSLSRREQEHPNFCDTCHSAYLVAMSLLRHIICLAGAIHGCRAASKAGLGWPNGPYVDMSQFTLSGGVSW